MMPVLHVEPCRLQEEQKDRVDDVGKLLKVSELHTVFTQHFPGVTSRRDALGHDALTESNSQQVVTHHVGSTNHGWPTDRCRAVPSNAETATGAEMAKSHLVTVAWQARHCQCYWEYIYIRELELSPGISPTLNGY